MLLLLYSLCAQDFKRLNIDQATVLDCLGKYPSPPKQVIPLVAFENGSVSCYQIYNWKMA